MYSCAITWFFIEKRKIDVILSNACCFVASGNVEDESRKNFNILFAFQCLLEGSARSKERLIPIDYEDYARLCWP